MITSVFREAFLPPYLGHKTNSPRPPPHHKSIWAFEWFVLLRFTIFACTLIQTPTGYLDVSAEHVGPPAPGTSTST
jgi:hypothetical protein